MFSFNPPPACKRKKSSSELFDIGSGEANCIACANLTGPIKNVGYACRRFNDPIMGSPISAIESRLDENICGQEAIGFVEKIGTAQVGKADTPVANDIFVGAGACSECKHSFSGKTQEYKPAIFCARLVDVETLLPVIAEEARLNEQHCGAEGRWYEVKPMPPGEIYDQLVNGFQHFYWVNY